MDSDRSETGKQLSFYKLLKGNDYIIEIPIIQRDYAQGRVTASDIRSHFLRALFECLTENNPIILDFIYGSILYDGTKTKFIPLDGQQRLTTLFLLHYFLALKEKRLDEFRQIIMDEGFSRFTYETRDSAKDFCNALVTNDILLAEDNIKLVSSSIRNASWFFISWEKDPTVKSMLKMLDDIHQTFSESEGLYDKLIDDKQPLISFQFIELKDFGLSDSLYVKMNARGKELTSFENFKAKFEQILERKDTDNSTDYRHEFSLKIDTDWTDLFWNYKDSLTNLFDEQLMNFFRIIATNNFALRKEEKNYYSNLKLLLGKEDPENADEKVAKIDFYKFEELKCLDDLFINDIITLLDFLKNGTGKIRTYLPDRSLIDEDQLFNKVISVNLTFKERLQFYGFYKYLIHNKTATGLNEWMRVIRNLTESIYNEVDEYITAIKSISELLPFSIDILMYLSGNNAVIKGFPSMQIEEEIIKAVLITKDNKWKNYILQIENHGYFTGQIGFILKFAGITDYFRDNRNLNWPESENRMFLNRFISYSDKSKCLFSAQGLIIKKDFIVERALLCQGDYLLWKRRNYSFLIDSSNERDIYN